MKEMDGVDARRPGWFWADNEILDEHAAKVGVRAFAVYMALARFVNSDAACWPSTDRIAKLLGMSRPTVSKAIHSLHEHGLITIEERVASGKGQISHRYTLLDRENIRQRIPQNAISPVNAVYRGNQYTVHSPVNGVDTPCQSPLHEQDIVNKTHTTTTARAADNGRSSQRPLSAVEDALKALGIRADQRREILKAQPDITPLDLAPWQTFYAAPPPWCHKPEAYIYTSLKNGDPVPVERQHVPHGSTMPDPSDQVAFRAYLNGNRP
jgi:predicted transcriptional regulator